MIGVSPPQKGKAQGSQIEVNREVNKDLKTSSQSEKYKSDFEKTLKEKLALKKKEAENSQKNETREESISDEKGELKAEKKDRKSFGGTKKKMTDDDDDKMVSNIMASVENEVEIPKSKIDLAEIEVGIPEKTELSAVSQLQTEALGGELAQIAKPQVQTEFEAIDESIAPAVTEKPVQNNEPTLTAQSMQSLEQELGEQVGFQAQPGLVEKLKTFEAEKNIAPEKVQAFEKSVFEQLQKSAVPEISKKSDDSQGDSFSEPEQKSDLKPLADLKQPGPTHGDFKTELKLPIATSPENQIVKMSDDHTEKNIQEIMNRAQYLVKQGGGEMKVSLSPEGLGDVQLKVLLQDGKVNIEMQTQDRSVKKLIEDSLTELKSGLAAHHLSVDRVKIDTVNATNTDNSAQFQSNWNQTGSESRQREFWQQVQEKISQNQTRRANYSESVGSLATKSSALPQSDLTRAYGGTKGSTLNRVA